MSKKVLHLTLKKKWFDMIASGEKKEEYRGLKPYWVKRLIEYSGDDGEIIFKPFSIARFKNGYQANAPIIDVELRMIDIRSNGNSEWGFVEKCFVLFLGEIIPYVQ